MGTCESTDICTLRYLCLYLTTERQTLECTTFSNRPQQPNVRPLELRRLLTLAGPFWCLYQYPARCKLQTVLCNKYSSRKNYTEPGVWPTWKLNRRSLTKLQYRYRHIRVIFWKHCYIAAVHMVHLGCVREERGKMVSALLSQALQSEHAVNS